MTNMKNVLVYCKSVTLPQTLFLPPPPLFVLKLLKKNMFTIVLERFLP